MVVAAPPSAIPSSYPAVFGLPPAMLIRISSASASSSSGLELKSLLFKKA